MAYMFIARKNSVVVGHRVRDDILPNESSVSICLRGASSYGQDFVHAWIDSCYLADGTKLMANPYCEKLVRQILHAIGFLDRSGNSAPDGPG